MFKEKLIVGQMLLQVILGIKVSEFTSEICIFKS